MTDSAWGILFTAAVGLLWSGIGVFHSRVGRRNWSIPLYYAYTGLFSCLLLAGTVVRWSVLFSGQMSRIPELVGVIAPAAVLNILAMMFLLAAMRSGHNGFSWTIGQSAMMIPFTASVVLWGDPTLPIHWAGVLLSLCALVLIGLQKENAPEQSVSAKWIYLAFCGFLLNGIAQTCHTIPSRWAGWKDTANLRPFLGTFTGFVFSAVWAATGKKRPDRDLLLTAAGAACIGTLSNVLLYQAMDRMSRAGMLALVYPLAVSVCIVAFNLYSFVVLKERFGRWGFLASFLGVTGIILLSMR